jgi:hypothetical protein
MIRISQVKSPSPHKEDIERALLTKLHISKQDLHSWTIRRKSTDARHRQVLFSYVIDASVKNEKRFLKYKDVTKTPDETYRFVPSGKHVLKNRPVVAGFGPAGMAAAMLLAKMGYCPLVLERGKPIDERQKDVDHFWKTGELNPESNVQFGEGGAGAFSDGKLTTRSKDLRVKRILEDLVQCGASPDILIENHPHIGTDAFVDIIQTWRKTIEDLGGEFRFQSKLEGIELEDGKLEFIIVNGQALPCQALILALGHSAADTMRALHKDGLVMENKPFQVGVRIEHDQTFIDKAMLHDLWQDKHLTPARYALTHMASNGKGVWTFCMCPGGYVIDSSSVPGQMVVNGMSYADRAGSHANSALLVQVNEDDYGTELFAGLEYQEELEKKAFQLGLGKAPVQKAKDYLAHTNTGLKTRPTVSFWQEADLNELFSPAVNQALAEGLEAFEKVVPGWLEGTMTGVESRASSSLRIVRDKQFMADFGIFPAGEGAGYAGGIVTSMADGMKCAEALMSCFDKPSNIKLR